MSPGAEVIEEWLIDRLAERLELDPGEIDPLRPFAHYGLRSVDVVALKEELERWLGRALSTTLAFEYPTIRSLSGFLADGDSPPGPTAAPDAERIQHISESDDPLAIVGMACRVPGAAGVSAYWALLRSGVEAIGPLPPARRALERSGDCGGGERRGGYLDGVEGFDAAFFHISPREAEAMDPQQRILLEVAWEALEDAGCVPAALAGSRTGVFVGISGGEYAWLQVGSPRAVDAYFATGSALSIAANRISYVLGLEGPSLAVDTACSSSLVALHLAIQSLRGGECEAALAGGVNLLLGPEITRAMGQAGVLSPAGRCRAFDAEADGTVRSEGCGVVVLKRLAAAEAAGDRIYAVIRGSAVNNDGTSNGLMAPSPAAQESLLRAAYARAGVDPRSVAYVEAHGTGTALGDPIEAKALGAVVGAERPGPCRVGSVKTNLGHLEAAAGVAGVIKAALCLWHRAWVPSLHFERPNPLIAFEALGLRVQTRYEPWEPGDGPVRIGVSSFGFGGTNAHLVLEERPAADTAEDREPAPPPDGCTREEILPISARSPDSLRRLAQAYRDRAADPSVDLHDLAFSAAAFREAHPLRLAVVADSRAALVEKLDAFAAGQERPGIAHGRADPAARHRIAFVFSGQGSQWPGMARELFEKEAPFRAALERVDAAISAHDGWSILAELFRDEAEARFDEVEIVQPILSAVQVALAEQWRSWGVEPAAVVGHSLGEVAAAFVAGAVDLDTMVRIICARSRALRRTSRRGGMLAVDLPPRELEALIAGFDGRLCISACNSPRSTLLSGDHQALAESIERLEREGVFCRSINVVNAGHSPEVEPLLGELRSALDDIEPRSGGVPLYSTVTGDSIAGTELGSAYWARNLREPVRFWDTIQRMVEAGVDTFLEVSPHGVLVGAVRDGVRTLKARDILVLGSLRRSGGERAALLESLGSLYCTGRAVDWPRVHGGAGRRVPLPAYPWDHQRLWVPEEDGAGAARRPRRISRAGEAVWASPLLRRYLSLAPESATHCWETELDTETFPFLADHRVGDQIVLPGAVLVEMARAAAGEVFADKPAVVEALSFEQPVLLSAGRPHRIQLVLKQRLGGGELTFFARAGDDSSPDGLWSQCASATLRTEGEPIDPPTLPWVERVRESSREEMEPAGYYRELAARGLGYGAAFQGIDALWRGDGCGLARLRLPACLETESHAYPVHPVLIDAAFQTVGAALAGTGEGGADATFVPAAVAEFTAVANPVPSDELWAAARLRELGGDECVADVALHTGEGACVAEIRGLSLRRLDGRARSVDATWHSVRWSRCEASATPEVLDGAWLVFADRGGVGDELCRALEKQGASCLRVVPGDRFTRKSRDGYTLRPDCAEHYERLVREMVRTGQPQWRGAVFLWPLDPAPDREAMSAALERGCLPVVHALQAVARSERPELARLFLVTRGAQAVPDRGAEVRLDQAPLWGLGRVLALEHPELRPRRVDLDPDFSADEAVRRLLQELAIDDDEDEVARRARDRYVARLAQMPPPRPAPKDQVATADQAFRLSAHAVGTLEQLCWRACERRAPGPGEVEIEVRASALNFKDVFEALGAVPSSIDGEIGFGGECAGMIARIGEGVDGLSVGQPVAAVAAHSLARFVVTPAAFVVPKPECLSFTEAASVPIAYMTALYALDRAGRLGRGESVLIHAAAGGVGMAAVEIARSAGAEIWATAGSEEKRDYLRSLGIRNVLDSRSLEFADSIRERTGNRGVDVVLNSLAGDGAARSLETLAPFGRFLELGVRDIYAGERLSLAPFRNNLTYAAIDMVGLREQHPDVIASLLNEVMARIHKAEWHALPVTVFGRREVKDAFRYLAQARHIGKVVVSLEPEPRGEEALRLEGAGAESLSLSPEAAYLVTGGLGSLGLCVARWMVERGARHLVLVGRSAPSVEAEREMEAMRAAGARVAVEQVDVADGARVSELVAGIEASGAPLRGVVHAAGVLDDGLLLQQDADRFARVWSGKAEGAWNLHRATRRCPLDFFVMYSSAAALLGSPGQANYAAANAFLDALAQSRRAGGLPGLSVQWGPWAEVGAAAASENRGARLETYGVGSLPPDEGLHALERLLVSDAVEMGVVRLDPSRWREMIPGVAHWPRFGELVRDVPVSADGPLRRELLALDSRAEREMRLADFLRHEIATVLRCAPDRVGTETPFTDLGIDSLMGLELRNRLEAALGMTISGTLIFTHPTVSDLVPALVARIDGPPARDADVRETESGGGEEDPGNLDGILRQIEALSEEGADALLDRTPVGAD